MPVRLAAPRFSASPCSLADGFGRSQQTSLKLVGFLLASPTPTIKGSLIIEQACVFLMKGVTSEDG